MRGALAVYQKELSTYFRSPIAYYVVAVFLLMAEYYFFEEFKSRYNTVAIDYLLYPKEVFINIWDTYPVPIIIAVCSLVAAGFVLASQKATRGMWETPVGVKGKLLHLAGALALAAGAWFSVRLEETRFSQERVINEIANNGLASLVTAAWSRNLDYAPFYPTLPRDEAFRRTRRMLAEPGAEFEGPPDSLRRRISGNPANPRLNVVILLEESLGSELALAERAPGDAQLPSFRINGATRDAVAEKTYLQEWHYFFQNTCRWRDLRKITIAQVQGNAISAGLMLIWACDLIVAARGAKLGIPDSCDIGAIRQQLEKIAEDLIVELSFSELPHKETVP